ncbi:MAG: hypothetical protein DRI48_10175, partial [Chloroflexi bacterium]
MDGVLRQRVSAFAASRGLRFTFCVLLFVSCVFLPGESGPAARGWMEAEAPAVVFAFVGDVMLGRGVAQALEGDWEAAFAGVQPWLADADLAFANLESPLTTVPQVSEGYDLRAPPEAVVALRTAGFDVVSLANNHALDGGEVGLQETEHLLSRAGIIPLVERASGRPSANVPLYHLLAFDDSGLPLDVEAAAQTVAAAAEQTGIVVVSIHWGGEYQAAPGPRQRAVARALTDAGADLIVGHGPHVLQRIEWVGE